MFGEAFGLLEISFRQANNGRLITVVRYMLGKISGCLIKKRLLVLQPKEEINKEARVADLIDWTSKGWQTNRLRKLFDVGTFQAICQIPIGSINNSDVPIWNATSRGEFTMRSAYHL
jgi:hypothetical protein